MKILKIILKRIFQLILIALSMILLVGVAVYFNNKNAKDLCASFSNGMTRQDITEDLERQNIEFYDPEPPATFIMIRVSYLLTYPASCMLRFEEDKLVEATSHNSD